MKALYTLLILLIPFLGYGQICCLNGSCIENTSTISNQEDCIWFTTIALCEPNCSVNNDKWYCKNDWTGTKCDISYYDDLFGTWDFEGVYELYDNLQECQAFCNTISIAEINNPNKKLKKITNLLAQDIPIRKNTLMLYFYNDGSIEKKFIIE
jgi:hypothetical protein